MRHETISPLPYVTNHGFLIRKHGRRVSLRSNPKLWFVLQGPQLTYHKQAKRYATDLPTTVYAAAHGVLNMSECSSVDLQGDRDLVLHMAGGKTVHLTAPSDHEAQRWHAALTRAIDSSLQQIGRTTDSATSSPLRTSTSNSALHSTRAPEIEQSRLAVSEDLSSEPSATSFFDFGLSPNSVSSTTAPVSFPLLPPSLTSPATTFTNETPVTLLDFAEEPVKHHSSAHSASSRDQSHAGFLRSNTDCTAVEDEKIDREDTTIFDGEEADEGTVPFDRSTTLVPLLRDMPIINISSPPNSPPVVHHHNTFPRSTVSRIPSAPFFSFRAPGGVAVPLTSTESQASSLGDVSLPPPELASLPVTPASATTILPDSVVVVLPDHGSGPPHDTDTLGPHLTTNPTLPIKYSTDAHGRRHHRVIPVSGTSV